MASRRERLSAAAKAEKVLLAVSEASGSVGEVVMTKQAIGDLSGMSEWNVRTALEQLRDAGLLEIEANRRSSMGGGQIANTYRLTDEARALIAARAEGAQAR